MLGGHSGVVPFYLVKLFYYYSNSNPTETPRNVRGFPNRHYYTTKLWQTSHITLASSLLFWKLGGVTARDAVTCHKAVGTTWWENTTHLHKCLRQITKPVHNCVNGCEGNKTP